MGGGVEVKTIDMKNRNVVLILLGIIIVTCTVGLLSLKYNQSKDFDARILQGQKVALVEDSLLQNNN